MESEIAGEYIELIIAKQELNNIINTPKMKTSKVSKVVSAKPYTRQHGTTIYHNLLMENGDKINIGKKNELKGGEELTYELTGGEDDQQEYKKAKAVKPENSFGGGSKFEPKDASLIAAQSCLGYACTLNQQSQKAQDTDYILQVAEKFHKWVMSKKTA